MKTVVLLLMLNGNYTVDVTPIYFTSLEACEAAVPAVRAQVEETRWQLRGERVTTKCYEESSK